MRKNRKKWQAAALTAAAAFCALHLWAAAAEPAAHWSPDYAKRDISTLLSQPQLSTEDYQTLLLQTGLAPPVIDALRTSGQTESILLAQTAFFRTPTIICTPNTPISAEEHTANGTRLAALEDGDILLTPCSHTYGWRNGHAALVIDAAQGLTLESVVLGQNSCLQSIGKWETYPAVMVCRLRGASSALRSEIASAACERLCNVPYSLTVGLLSGKHPKGAPKATHCAHLVWEAYRAYGFDLDSNGGCIVTPHDLACSPLLELKQVYGMNPQSPWP